MDQSISSLRHAARGCFNAIKLCASALDLPCTYEEEIEFIEDIIRATDKMGGLITELESAYEATTHPTPQP